MKHLYFLATDIFIWGMVSVGLAYACWCRKQHIHRQAWQYVAQRPVALAGGISLLFFLLIGLLDSIHWQTTTTPQPGIGAIFSTLDQLIPMAGVSETTYSEPFATQLFQSTVLPGHRGNEALHHIQPILGWFDWFVCYTWTLLSGLFVAIFMTLIYKFKQKKKQPKPIFCWRNPSQKTCMITVIIWVMLCVLCIQLNGHYHIFGTDKVGGDVFYQCIKSIRTGLVIGCVTTLFMLPFAILLGLSAGFFGGWVDDIIQMIYTTLSSIPGVLLISAAVLSLQIYMGAHQSWFPSVIERADIRLLALCIILGATGWTPLARLLRAETLKLREMSYIDAAKLMGIKKTRMLFKHLLPNVMHLVLMTIVLDFSGLVLAEAVLSYVGVGVDPSTHSWGNIINAARLELARDPIVWWPLASAFLLMFSLVLSANLLADTLRQAFNPKANIKRH